MLTKSMLAACFHPIKRFVFKLVLANTGFKYNMTFLNNPGPGDIVLTDYTKQNIENAFEKITFDIEVYKSKWSGIRHPNYIGAILFVNH